jgi:hypothetical protein
MLADAVVNKTFVADAGITGSLSILGNQLWSLNVRLHQPVTWCSAKTLMLACLLACFTCKLLQGLMCTLPVVLQKNKSVDYDLVIPNTNGMTLDT